MSMSLSGLDLPWLKKDRPCQPGRYRTDPKTGESVTIQEWRRRNPDERKRGEVASPYFVPDVDAAYGGSWESIIDGTEISSRSNWREHNRRNDVVDVGDKYWSEDGDDIKTTEEKMGYAPELIGSKDFYWGKDNPALD